MFNFSHVNIGFKSFEDGVKPFRIKQLIMQLS